MSKSAGNAILLKDEPEQIGSAVQRMPTKSGTQLGLSCFDRLSPQPGHASGTAPSG